jgi:hypothetical protein
MVLASFDLTLVLSASQPFSQVWHKLAPILEKSYQNLVSP